VIFVRRRRRLRRTAAILPDDADRSTDQLAYELVWFRALDKDVQMWQAPALALTAQSFLLTIALGSGSSPAARMISAALACLIAVMSVQLLTKHQWLLRQDFDQLDHLETRLGLQGLTFRRRRVESSDESVRRLTRPTFWRKQRSVLWWQIGLALFGITAFAVLVLAVVNPQLLEGAGGQR
jgi:hypothetical protein